MLTIFAIPKPFYGKNEVIQINAIKSWTLLKPRPEIILFGDDDGARDAAKDLGVQHFPKVARSENGAPLLNDLFAKAQSKTDNTFLCYVNADIILMGDFMEAFMRVVQYKRRFLMVGQRWDIEIENRLDFSYNWEENLKENVLQHGKLHPVSGIDYFVFSRGVWGEIPPFNIGRGYWDNWLIHRARSRFVPVINTTQVVTAIHQNHDWSHIPGGRNEALIGPDAQINKELSIKHVFDLDYVTHELTNESLTKTIDIYSLLFRKNNKPFLIRIRSLLWKSRQFINKLLAKFQQ